jgi:hypothetical protein
MMPGQTQGGTDRKLLWIIAALVVGLLVMGGVGFALLGGDDKGGNQGGGASGTTQASGQTGTGSASASGRPSASATKSTSGSGKYKHVQSLAPLVDLSSLTAAYGQEKGAASNSSSTGGSYSIVTFVQMFGAKYISVTIQAEYCSTAAAAQQQYGYELNSAKTSYSPKAGVKEPNDVGEASFLNMWDTSTKDNGSFRLWARDSNILITIAVRGVDSASGTWTSAEQDKVFATMTPTAKALLPKLASA